MPRPRKPTTGEIEAAAARFSVSERTIRRWLDSGLAVDALTDLEAVGTFLLSLRAPSAAAMEAITSKTQ